MEGKTMKKYLLPQKGNFYKANMHSHTVISDGKLTAEEVKAAYKERGYSIVAFTDHEIMIPHYDLRDESFLPITAYEIQLRDWNRASRCIKLYHMNVYSPDPERYLSKTYCKKDAWWGNIVNHFTDEMAAAEESVSSLSSSLNSRSQKGMKSFGRRFR